MDLIAAFFIGTIGRIGRNGLFGLSPRCPIRPIVLFSSITPTKNIIIKIGKL